MEPIIKTFSEKKLVGKRMVMTFARNSTGELWKSFMQSRKEIPNNIGSDLYSIQIYPPGFFEMYDKNLEFEKWATMEVSDFTVLPDGMESFVLPSGLYAVFDYQGLPTEAGPTFQYILRTWIPNSDYDLDDRPHFEILGERYKKDDPSSEEEIWIPIRPKV